MPIYTYRCQSCGAEFERVQKFSDKPLTKCPECRKGTVRRVLQPPAIVFKGSGWYATDHRSASGASSKAEKADGAAKAAEKSEKSENAAPAKADGDSKPAKKDSKAPSSEK